MRRALFLNPATAGLFFWPSWSYNNRPSDGDSHEKWFKETSWTSVQIRDLKTMARKKTPASRIAKKLKRTEGATRQKAFSMGLSLDSR
jgi:hypothetical protein